MATEIVSENKNINEHNYDQLYDINDYKGYKIISKTYTKCFRILLCHYE